MSDTSNDLTKWFAKKPKRLVGTYWVHRDVLRILEVSKGRVLGVSTNLSTFKTGVKDLLYRFAYVGRDLPFIGGYVIQKETDITFEVGSVVGEDIQLRPVRGDFSINPNVLGALNEWRYYHVLALFEDFRLATSREVEIGEEASRRLHAWNGLTMYEDVNQIRQICDASWVEPIPEPSVDKLPALTTEPVRLSAWERLK